MLRELIVVLKEPYNINLNLVALLQTGLIGVDGEVVVAIVGQVHKGGVVHVTELVQVPVH